MMRHKMSQLSRRLQRASDDFSVLGALGVKWLRAYSSDYTLERVEAGVGVRRKLGKFIPRDEGRKKEYDKSKLKDPKFRLDEENDGARRWNSQRLNANAGLERNIKSTDNFISMFGGDSTQEEENILKRASAWEIGSIWRQVRYLAHYEPENWKSVRGLKTPETSDSLPSIIEKLKREAILRSERETIRMVGYTNILSAAEFVLPKAEAFSMEKAMRSGIVNRLSNAEELELTLTRPKTLGHLWKTYQRLYYQKIIPKDIFDPLSKFTENLVERFSAEKRNLEDGSGNPDEETSLGLVLCQLAQILKLIPRGNDLGIVLESIARQAAEALGELSNSQFCELLDCFATRRWAPSARILMRIKEHMEGISPQATGSELTAIFKFYPLAGNNSEKLLQAMESRLMEIADNDHRFDMVEILRSYAALERTPRKPLEDAIVSSIERGLEERSAKKLEALILVLDRMNLPLPQGLLRYTKRELKNFITQSRIQNLLSILSWYSTNNGSLDEDEAQMLDSRIAQILENQDPRGISFVLHILALFASPDHRRPNFDKSSKVLEANLATVCPGLAPRAAIDLFRFCVASGIVLAPRVAVELVGKIKEISARIPNQDVVEIFAGCTRICGQPENFPEKSKPILEYIKRLFINRLDVLEEEQIEKILLTLELLSLEIPKEMRHMRRLGVGHVD